MKSKSTTKQTLSIFWRYTKKYPFDFTVGSLGAVFAVIAQNIIPPLIVANIFKQLQYAFAHNQPIEFSMFVSSFLLFALFMLAGMVFWRIQSYYVWLLEIKVRRDSSNEIYNHLQAQSQRFHANRFGGALVSQTNKFTSAYERMMDDLIWNIIPGITTLLAAVIVLCFINYIYALLMVIVSILYMLLMGRRLWRQMPYSADEAGKDSKKTAALADSITNMSTIRAFGNEKYESKRFAGVVETHTKSFKILAKEVLKTEALSHSQTNGFQVLALLGGLVAVTSFQANVSLLYLLLSYTQAIVNQLWQFSRVVRNINRSLGDSVEMTEILQIQPDIKDPSEPQQVRMPRGEVVFKGVDFAYPENTEQGLFRQLTLKIKPGEKVGLVGPSGGGKTTITSLLLRAMDVDGGEITIDGQNIAKVKQSELRQHIAYVAQEPILFHRSLGENIGYGNLEASQREIEAVAKMANAHYFISKLPKGYKTLVGERGVKLSGGQRQRVAIARAMLKNAPILVLDEATSALDSESEVLIQDALWRLMEGRTALVIAHRLSTIQKMDRIIVLDEGKIAEQGSHKELLSLDGTYAKLWQHQSGGFLED